VSATSKNSQTQNVEIRLLGQKISLKAAGDPERVREIAAIVAGKLKTAEKRARGSGTVPHWVALLAMFDLAEDLVRARERVDAHQAAMGERADELVRLIEAELS
jgi:hypothetical protein